MKLKRIQDEDVKGKRVFLRADLDVPVEKSKIKNQKSKVADSSRLEAWFPTLEYLLSQDAKVIIAGHIGRPPKRFTIDDLRLTKENQEYSLKPIAEWIASKLGIRNSEFRIENKDGFNGWRISENTFLLENLRFFKEEEENNDDFSKKLANLANIYINDAFASSHRVHASIVGITKYLPSYAGLRVLKEVEELSKVLENPKRPLCVVIGGAKIETKLPLVEKMHQFADYVLVGGEIAENDKVLLKVQHEKIHPPAGRQKSALLVADLTPNTKDITVKSAENFSQIAQSCQTIVWNGPMGLISNPELKIQNSELDTERGTRILAQALARLSSYRIVGGGDTVSYLKKENLLDKFDFVSTGGGAMLEFLVGVKLPGLLVLE